MKKYNLTFWQRISLIPTWFMWVTTPKNKRRDWHLIKKGSENHVCDFTIPSYYKDRKYWNCNHEGCNMCESNDFKNKKGIYCIK